LAAGIGEVLGEMPSGQFQKALVVAGTLSTFFCFGF
jgi:hypothetical protein